MTGDSFSIRVLVDGIEISAANDVAGSGTLDLCSVSGSNCTAGSQHLLTWLDGDTVRADWFDTTAPSPSRVVYEITGLDFASGPTAEGILAVTQRPSSLPPAQKLSISYSTRSIVLDYANLSSTDAGDGDFGVFDVESASSLADTYDISVSEEGIQVATASHVRGRSGKLDIVPPTFSEEYGIEWLDEDTFRVDWYTDTVADVDIVLTGLAFKNVAGKTGSIDGVVKGASGFPADPDVIFGLSSVSLNYADLVLAPFPESNDGDFRIFDIETTIPNTDFYSVELAADSTLLVTGTSARGATDSYRLIDDYEVSWVDDDTFAIDWFAIPIDDLTWTFRFRELEDASGNPLEILGVAKRDSGFEDDPDVSFTFDSVTISYSNIIDPASGDFRSFDLALPEPSFGSALLLGALLLTRFPRRRA